MYNLVPSTPGGCPGGQYHLPFSPSWLPLVSASLFDLLQGRDRVSCWVRLGLQKCSGSIPGTAKGRNGRHRVDPVNYLLRSTSGSSWVTRSAPQRGSRISANFKPEPRGQKGISRSPRGSFEGGGTPPTLGSHPPLWPLLRTRGAPWGREEAHEWFLGVARSHFSNI